MTNKVNGKTEIIVTLQKLTSGGWASKGDKAELYF